MRIEIILIAEENREVRRDTVDIYASINDYDMLVDYLVNEYYE